MHILDKSIENDVTRLCVFYVIMFCGIKYIMQFYWDHGYNLALYNTILYKTQTKHVYSYQAFNP